MSKTPPRFITDPERAEAPEGTVVMLIGMRINKLWAVHQWLPAFRSMVPMLKELHRESERFGFLGYEMAVGRTVILVQYWESMEKLMSYARDAGQSHVPAWRMFNTDWERTGAVGIFHEAYEVSPARTHSIYRNMPAFGLGRYTQLAAGRHPRTRTRLEVITSEEAA